MRSNLLAYLCVATVPLWAAAGCQGNNQPWVPDGDAITIIDQTGTEWDITYGVEQKGFDPIRFQFGLGPYAIQPLNHPEMLHDGDNGFPPPTDLTRILGTTIEGHTRAYPINRLGRYEIVNEVFGDTHVAVGY